MSAYVHCNAHGTVHGLATGGSCWCTAVMDPTTNQLRRDGTSLSAESEAEARRECILRGLWLYHPDQDWHRWSLVEVCQELASNHAGSLQLSESELQERLGWLRRRRGQWRASDLESQRSFEVALLGLIDSVLDMYVEP